MSTNKQIVKEFQEMKPSLVFKKLDMSKFPKEVREKIKSDLSGVSDDALDMQQGQPTFKKWIEMMADHYPAAFGLKVEKVPSLAPSVTPAASVATKDMTVELEAKIKDLETRSGVIKKMILKQPAKRDELKVRLKTVEKMIKKLGDDLKEAKKAQKKTKLKKSLGGFLLGAVAGVVAGQFIDLRIKKKSFSYAAGGTIEGNKKFLYSITYQLVTPESAEHGDYEKQGYEVEKQEAELQDILRDAVNNYGIYSTTGTISAGISFESLTPDHDRDYFEKGHEKYYTLHITHLDGSDLNYDESSFVANKLSEGRKLHWDDEDKEWWKDGGTIHSSDDEGILMFKADTKGGKYSIEVREHTNQLGTSYRVLEFTNGNSRGIASYNNKEIAVSRILDSIIGSKKIDSINYKISLDNLYIGEHLPLAEKMWDIYNSAEYRAWFKSQVESLPEEQKKAVAEELKNKAIKYVKDNGYREDDSTIGTFFQIFKKERMIADFLKSKGEPSIKENGGGLDNKDLLPPSGKYSEYLQLAISKFGISINEARSKYGQYTIGQWEELLNSGVKNKQLKYITLKWIPQMNKFAPDKVEDFKYIGKYNNYHSYVKEEDIDDVVKKMQDDGFSVMVIRDVEELKNGGDIEDTSNYAIVSYNKAKYGTTQNKGFKDAVEMAEGMNCGDIGTNCIIVKGSLIWEKGRVKGVQLENGEKVYYEEFQRELFTEKQLDYLQSIMINENGEKYSIFNLNRLDEYKKGGGVDEKKVDLFENPDLIPAEVQEILEKYWEEFGDSRDYEDTQRMRDEINAVGYTFDFYLDNEPYGLRKVGVELHELEGYEKMKKGGYIDPSQKTIEFKNKYGSLTLEVVSDFVKVKDLGLVKDLPEDQKFSMETAEQIALITDNRGIQIVFDSTNIKIASVAVHDSVSTAAWAKIKHIDFDEKIDATEELRISPSRVPTSFYRKGGDFGYSAKSFQLTKEEFNYLLPALKNKLTQSGDRYYFISNNIEDLNDMLNRLKGLYDNYDELKNMVGYKCSMQGSLEPFRQSISNFKTEKQKYSKGGGVSDTPKVYIADLAAYNEGKLIGEWIDLSDFSSGEEVMDKISELMEKWSKEQGEEREEYAVHDMENFPKDLYGESMGEEDFQKVIDYWEAVSNSDYPKEVVEEFMALTNDDDFSGAISNMDSAYQGKYSDAADFAEQLINDIGMPSNPEQYLYVTDTDKRIVAGEQADNDLEDMSDDDILDRADMKEEYEEREQKESDIESLEEEIYGLDKEDDADEIEEKQSELDNLNDELSKMDTLDEILAKAKEKVHDEIYEEWHDGLDDPLQFLVKELGIYSEEDLMKANFVGFDYEAFAKDIEQDYHIIEDGGEVYVFSQNYKKGGNVKKNRKLANK